MIMTFMVGLFYVRRHVLICNLVLMIVKDVVADKTNQPLFGLLLVIALENFAVLDLFNHSVVNLFEVEEFAVVYLLIHYHLSLL
jgi:hypothetical protein